MTIRETLTNILRLPSDARAVVEMAREVIEFRKERHVETALRLRIARQREHIEKLQARARDKNDAFNKVLRELGEWQQRAKQADVRVGEVADRNNDLQNELVEAKALIGVQNGRLEALSARIRELEAMIDSSGRAPTPTMADLWRPIGDDEWTALGASSIVLVRGALTMPNQICSTVTRKYTVSGYYSHYIVLESPR